MADIFLLTDQQQKYFSTFTTALWKAFVAEGVDLNSSPITVKEDQLQRIGKQLPYKPENVLKKWKKATAGKLFFMLMKAEKYAPAPEKPEDAPLAENEFFFYGVTPEVKTRYAATIEWHYLRSDKRENLINGNPVLNQIEPNSPLHNLLTENADTWDREEIFEKARDELGLSGFYYLPLLAYQNMTLALMVCEEILKLQELPAAYEESGQEIAIPKSSGTYFGEGFSAIRQGIATNAIKPHTRGNTIIDPITNTATITAPIKDGSLIITIPNYSLLSGLKTSTLQLLDALVISLTESGAKTPTVILSVEGYMTRRGLKDRKEARKQFTADLAVLLGSSITWTENGIPKRGISITDSWEWVDKKKSAIAFTFGQSFYNVLKGYPVMAYPDLLQRLNPNKNPNSFFLLRKIASQKNMNVSDINHGDIISVETLLAAAPYIPSYEEVMRGNRNTLNRIIEPFERDMDALAETLTWEYCHSKGTPLTRDELKNMGYGTFRRLLVKIRWNNYPDQTKRLERKAQQIEAAKQKKPRRSPSNKKTTPAE